jgi:C2H2-type zinc finger/Zinc finger, C2H2 type
MFQKFILEHQCDADTKKAAKKRSKKASDDELDLKSYKCERCSVEFDTREELVCHQYSVCLEDPTFVCPICKKEFVNQRRLTEHKRTHQNRVFVCDECGHCTTSEVSVVLMILWRILTMFSSFFKPKLLNHKIVHSTERLSKCQECPATFKDGRSLKKHMQIHEVRTNCCFQRSLFIVILFGNRSDVTNVICAAKSFVIIIISSNT